MHNLSKQASPPEPSGDASLYFLRSPFSLRSLSSSLASQSQAGGSAVAPPSAAGSAKRTCAVCQLKAGRCAAQQH